MYRPARRCLSIALCFCAVSALAACADRDAQSSVRPQVTLTVQPTVVARGGSTTLTWSASADASCSAAGAWSGNRPASGSEEVAALSDAVNIFSIACVGADGPARASAVVNVQEGREAGLDFPGSAATTGTVRFRFTDPLDIYPATYVWRVYLRSQPEYYTAFFWGNDGEFQWDDGHSDTYYGAHPYPYPAPNIVPAGQVGPRYWEIAVDGLDVLSEEQVEYGRWHVQALRVWSDVFGKHHEFYWDLPDTTRVVKKRLRRSYGNKPPPRPALTWGDAPWAPSKEIMYGIMRGIQIYSTELSMRDLLSEVKQPLSTQAGNESIWYVNLNPTPTNITDHSGAGNQPEWVGPERPNLWTAQ
jgi:hypothetical protein